MISFGRMVLTAAPLAPAPSIAPTFLALRMPTTVVARMPVAAAAPAPTPPVAGAPPMAVATVPTPVVGGIAFPTTSLAVPAPASAPSIPGWVWGAGAVGLLLLVSRR